MPGRLSSSGRQCSGDHSRACRMHDWDEIADSQCHAIYRAAAERCVAVNNGQPSVTSHECGTVHYHRRYNNSL